MFIPSFSTRQKFRVCNMVSKARSFPALNSKPVEVISFLVCIVRNHGRFFIQSEYGATPFQAGKSGYLDTPLSIGLFPGFWYKVIIPPRMSWYSRYEVIPISGGLGVGGCLGKMWVVFETSYEIFSSSLQIDSSPYSSIDVFTQDSSAVKLTFINSHLSMTFSPFSWGP